MGMTDPVADMLTRIRNASRVRFEKVDIPASKLKAEVARIMKDEGFIRDFKVVKDSKQGVLRVFLKYDNQKRGAFAGLKRLSRPGRRIYVRADDIPPVLGGLGVSILSTSRGLMTDKEARRTNVGGELLCELW